MGPAIILDRVRCTALRGSCQAIETECRVPLLEQTGALKPGESPRQLYLVVMLGDYEAIGSEEVRRIEKLEHAKRFVLFLVRRVEKGKNEEQGADCGVLQAAPGTH